MTLPVLLVYIRNKFLVDCEIACHHHKHKFGNHNSPKALPPEHCHSKIRGKVEVVNKIPTASIITHKPITLLNITETALSNN